MLMVLDKTTHKAFRIHENYYKQSPLEIFYSTVYQNYTLALILDILVNSTTCSNIYCFTFLFFILNDKPQQ